MTIIRPYDQCLTIANDAVRLSVAPDLGAAVLAFDFIGEGTSVPVFRRTPDVIDSAFECAMTIMLPWVNRISIGGIWTAGNFHPIEPNLPGEPFPNHGNGFQSAWAIPAQSETSISLALYSNGPGPYCYHASYDLSLDGTTLVARLEIKNCSRLRLPFGAGFHPWFERRPSVGLKAAAGKVWLEDERYIPTEAVSVDSVPDFDFRSRNHLPDRWINNSFTGWDGEAEITWPERALRLKVSSPATQCYHIYSPAGDAPFFCFETETHIPDAANLLPANAAGAPAWLSQGEMLIHEARFEVLR